MAQSFLKNISFTGIATLLVVIVSFINNIIVTRWIGPENRGVYSVVLTLVFFTNLLFGEGLRRTNTLMAAKGKDKLFSLLLLNSLFLVFLIIIFSLLYIFSSLFFSLLLNISLNVLLVALVISISLIMWQAIQAIFLGYQQIKVFNFLAVFSVVCILTLNTIGIYFFNISLDEILLNIFWSYMGVFIIGTIILVPQVQEKQKIELSFLRNQLKTFIRATISSIDIFFIKKSNVLFVNNLIGAKNAGFYSIASTISDLIQKFPNVVGTIVFSDSANNNSKDYLQKLNRVLKYLLWFDVLLVVILFLFGEFLIVLFFGDAFRTSFVPLKWMLFSFVLIGPSSIIHAYFMGKNFPRLLIIINSASAIFAIFAYYFFVVNFDIIGAGIGYSLILIFWSISYYIYYLKETNSRLGDILIINKNDVELILFLIKTILREK